MPLDSQADLEEREKAGALLADNYAMVDDFWLERLGRRAFLLDFRDRFLVLKYHDVLCLPNYPQLNALYGVCSGCGLAPRVLPNKDGNYLSRDKNQVFSLQEYMDCTPFSEPYLDAVSEKLALFHHHARGVNAEGVKNHLERVVTDMKASAVKYGYENLIPIQEKVEGLSSVAELQIIHGDMHRGNVIISDDNVLLIDFDSCTSSPVVSEVAFAAFRLCDGRVREMKRFVETYNKSSKGCQVALGDALYFVVYNVLQRVLFILIRNGEGDSQWMYDLENQKGYLAKGLEILNAEKRYL